VDLIAPDPSQLTSAARTTPCRSSIARAWVEFDMRQHARARVDFQACLNEFRLVARSRFIETVPDQCSGNRCLIDTQPFQRPLRTPIPTTAAEPAFNAAPSAAIADDASPNSGEHTRAPSRFVGLLGAEKNRCLFRGARETVSTASGADANGWDNFRDSRRDNRLRVTRDVVYTWLSRAVRWPRG